MKKNQLMFIIATFALVLLAACTSQEGTSTAIAVTPQVTATMPVSGTETLTTGTGTASIETETTTTAASTESTPAAGLTGTPAVSTTGTASIPVTGPENILIEAQFCIDNMANAVLVLPDTATFEVVTPATTVTEPGMATGCNAVDTFNGRQIVLCRAEQGTTMTLNICTSSSTCTELAVNLQSCPEAASPQINTTPTVGLNFVTEVPSTGSTATPLAVPTVTPVVAIPTATP